ncbi:MAG: hypothetical protein IPN69_08015, partial [Acidobacteria bacterium]|nr:hypothetical protein [Acidobacteriota bacterium]
RTKTLKLGIAGGLVGDWALYDSIYTERYMRTPQNNPDGYAKGSVIANAKDLNGKLRSFTARSTTTFICRMRPN